MIGRVTCHGCGWLRAATLDEAEALFAGHVHAAHPEKLTTATEES